jgi:hypothetical protein
MERCDGLALPVAIAQMALLLPPLGWGMAPFIYRCPSTGMKVQGWLADDPSEDEGEAYETVSCLACKRLHLVSRSNGRVLGGDE